VTYVDQYIVKKAVYAAIQALLNELSKKFQDITDYMAVLETGIEKLEAEAEQKTEDQPNMNGNLQTTLEAIRKENQRTRAAANDTEQYGRRNNLRFRGLKVKKDESCRKTVTDFINRRLQLSISENDIEIAHQLPNRKPTGDATQGQQLQERGSETGTSGILSFMNAGSWKGQHVQSWKT